MEKLKVGQEVFVKSLRSGEEVQKDTVKKVGRLYFYLDGKGNDKFFIKSRENHHDTRWSGHWKVYTSTQAIEDEKEAIFLANSISEKVNSSFSLDDLRRIASILKIKIDKGEEDE